MNTALEIRCDVIIVFQLIYGKTDNTNNIHQNFEHWKKNLIQIAINRLNKLFEWFEKLNQMSIQEKVFSKLIIEYKNQLTVSIGKLFCKRKHQNSKNKS